MWLSGNNSSCFAALLFLSFRTIASAQEYKQEKGIVLERTIEEYISDNYLPIDKCRRIIAGWTRGTTGDYRLGWSAFSRIQQRLRQDAETEEAVEEGRGAFELVPMMSLLETNEALQMETTKLRRVVQDAIDGKEEPPVEIEPDPYENPFAHTIQYYEEQERIGPKGRLVPTEPLRIYTDLAGKEAIARIDQLLAFNKNLLPHRAKLLEGFFWFYERPGDKENTSILGLLSDFVDTMSRGGTWNDWTWTVREFVDWVWVIPDEVHNTDTYEASDSDLEYESDIEYETVLPDRRDYQINGKEAFVSGLRGLFHALSKLITEYESVVINTFQPPLIKSHPEVNAAYDLARQQFGIMMFHYESMLKILEVMDEIPPLVSKWVEPTRSQVIYAYRNGLLKKFGPSAENIPEDYFVNFPHSFNAPLTATKLPAQTQEEEEEEEEEEEDDDQSSYYVRDYTPTPSDKSLDDRDQSF
ncbi:hypothetical protein AA313_de0208446 [Arthrobotrys entomopaga]|nr:hypothetical protein AA313_de0208446 [Arthrobotrys entomopaga]